MTALKIGDRVTWDAYPSYGEGTVEGVHLASAGELVRASVRFDNYREYDDYYDGGLERDHHAVPFKDLTLVGDTPDSPTHYKRIKELTGVETWDILDEVAGDDPDMWNLGKYWFRAGHKEGQSTLTEKKKMLRYLERSIAKEENH